MDSKDRKLLKELSSQIFSKKSVNLSSYSREMIDAVVNLTVVENETDLKKLKNYDYFLVVKKGDDYLFLDTSMVDTSGPLNPLIKLENYNLYLRKEKLKKINEEE